MFYYIKRFLQFILILILVILLVVFIYLGIQDIYSSKAKEYLVNEYGYSKYKIYAYHVIEFAKNDNSCKDNWFKKCTEDETIEKKVKFITFDKQKIEVVQYKDGSFEDNLEK